MGSVIEPAPGEHEPGEPVVTDDAERDTSGDHGFFGQPRPLVHIFGVEMWERFSFYGMQGILLLYLYYSVSDGGLGIDQAAAAGIVGAYGGAVYLSTILGAWIADRLLGSERVLFYSAIVIMGGHIALAAAARVPRRRRRPRARRVRLGRAQGERHVRGRHAVLASTTRGATPASRCSTSASTSARSSGPLITGLLQTPRLPLGLRRSRRSAWRSASRSTRSGARACRPWHPSCRTRCPRSRRGLVIGVAVAGGRCSSSCSCCTGVHQRRQPRDVVIGGTIVATISYFVVILRSSRITAVERRRVFAFIPLFIASVAFWSLYQQQFTVLTIYSDEQLDRSLFGWVMPVPWVQSINPIFIIVLSGVFAAHLDEARRPTAVDAGQVRARHRASWASRSCCSCRSPAAAPNSTPLLAMVGILLVFTVAELLLSPVGLSVATKLAPEVFHTQMVALFFLSVALGTAISGMLAAVLRPSRTRSRTSRSSAASRSCSARRSGSVASRCCASWPACAEPPSADLPEERSGRGDDRSGASGCCARGWDANLKESPCQRTRCRPPTSVHDEPPRPSRLPRLRVARRRLARARHLHARDERVPAGEPALADRGRPRHLRGHGRASSSPRRASSASSAARSSCRPCRGSTAAG